MTGLAGAPAGALGEAYDRSSDLGMAVADLLTRRERQPRPGSATRRASLDVAATFAAIEAASGPAAQGRDRSPSSSPGATR